MNKNSYKNSNEVRFSNSLGIFTDILFEDNSLNNKNAKYDILYDN